MPYPSETVTALAGKRWTVNDKKGREIYLTHERWDTHIIPPENHPEMKDYEEEMKRALQSGKRKADALQLNTYRYTKDFGTDENGERVRIVVIVSDKSTENADGTSSENRFVVTAYRAT